jgi:hypothetical protein
MIRPNRQGRVRSFEHSGPSNTTMNFIFGYLGVFVVLAGLMALLAAVQPLLGPAPTGRSSAATPAVAATAEEPLALKVPWSRGTSKNPVFAALIAGRLKLLDPTPLYEELLRRPAPRRPQIINVRLHDMTIRFYPVTNSIQCYQFRLAENAGEPIETARLPSSLWAEERKRYDGARYFYFFWVSGDSFERFREIRDRMRLEGVEIGWKPVRPGSPLELCQGLDGGGSPVAQ